MTSVEDIDALLRAPKQIAGQVSWVADDRGASTKLAASILQDGRVGPLTLYASATLHTDPQRGSGALVMEGRPVQRLSFRPDHSHRNPFGPVVPSSLRGLSFPPNRTRVHLWPANRTWPRPLSDNVAVAEFMAEEPANVTEALTIFLHLCGIEGDLLPPPWEPRLL